MLPADLTAEHFASYPPLARQVATRGLDTLRELPLAFVPLLLAEVIAYDVKFPAERVEIDAQFAFLRALPVDGRRQAMSGFARLQMARELEAVPWVVSPGEFSERWSAHLWSTGQVAEFRAAAVEFLNAVRARNPPPPPVAPRLVMVVIGQGVTEHTYPLFRKLRPRGTFFSAVRPADGLNVLMRRAAARVQQHMLPFAHWYVDGGAAASPRPPGLDVLAYRDLDVVRDAVVSKLRGMIAAGTGTEARRSALMKLAAADVGLTGDGADAVRNHLKVTVMAEGSGVQFFSTTFVQWAARELLRRAQPLTLVARFAPRVTERSMNQALMHARVEQEFDSGGALIDADMGAYYTWLNAMRLPGSDATAFVVWFEGHSEALVVSPSVAPGAQSSESIDMSRLLDIAVGTRSG
jgi:hypothetical protein